MHLPGAEFLTSSLVVGHNAIKNIIFRLATITLDFVIMRVFGLLAFWQSDYTSFLMFGESVIQKAMFIFSRGVISRQSLFVGMFAFIAAAGESYDTMLWAIDNPGFIIKHHIVNGASLVSQIIDVPSYVVILSPNATSSRTINSFNTAAKLNLFAIGLNYSLPGINQQGTTEVVPALHPLDPLTTARIWLDDEGFAVGLDFTTMSTPHMLSNLTTACLVQNDPDPSTNAQIWNCNVPNSESQAMLDISFGMVPVWWDSYHTDVLEPNSDNPWSTLASGGGTMMMKQVFTVTKGVRRHTFESTVIKASMTISAPDTLDNAEITDFMRRTWSKDGTLTPDVQGLVDVVLQAKGNGTGRTFGEFFQANTSLSAMSTDYLIVVNTTGGPEYSMLRSISINTTLIRSETLAEPPTPFQSCPGRVYRNFATGGQAISTNCNLAASTLNQTVPLNHNLFLGQLDTSTVGIFNNGILGDGSSNLSAVALSEAGLNWIAQEKDNIDNVLISRALLLGGNSSAVGVDVAYNAPAISILQLVLSILPAALAIIAWLVTRSKAMRFYQSSFLATVLTTTHTIATPSEKLGHGGLMPEITLEERGRDVSLRTPYGGTIMNTVAIAVEEPVHEPLVQNKSFV